MEDYVAFQRLAQWERNQDGPSSLERRLRRLRKNSTIVIPRAGFAGGICFFPLFAKKQIPRFARDDN
jgi:hypothetical protein